jgi:hypothetical protein
MDLEFKSLQFHCKDSYQGPLGTSKYCLIWLMLNNHVLYIFLLCKIMMVGLWCLDKFQLKVKEHILDLQLPMQSVPITTNVVSLNPVQARCTRYNIMW